MWATGLVVEHELDRAVGVRGLLDDQTLLQAAPVVVDRAVLPKAAPNGRNVAV